MTLRKPSSNMTASDLRKDFDVYILAAYESALDISLPRRGAVPVGLYRQLAELRRLRRTLSPGATIGDIARAYLAHRVAVLEARRTDSPAPDLGDVWAA